MMHELLVHWDVMFFFSCRLVLAHFL